MLDLFLWTILLDYINMASAEFNEQYPIECINQSMWDAWHKSGVWTRLPTDPSIRQYHLSAGRSICLLLSFFHQWVCSMQWSMLLISYFNATPCCEQEIGNVWNDKAAWTRSLCRFSSSFYRNWFLLRWLDSVLSKWCRTKLTSKWYGGSIATHVWLSVDLYILCQHYADRSPRHHAVLQSRVDVARLWWTNLRFALSNLILDWIGEWPTTYICSSRRFSEDSFAANDSSTSTMTNREFDIVNSISSLGNPIVARYCFHRWMFSTTIVDWFH